MFAALCHLSGNKRPPPVAMPVLRKLLAGMVVAMFEYSSRVVDIHFRAIVWQELESFRLVIRNASR